MVYLRSVFSRAFGKARTGNEHTFICLVSRQCPYKFLNFRAPDIRLPTLGLYVNHIQPKPIFIDDAIDTAITTFSNHSPRIFLGAAIPHLQQQFDDQFLKTRWTDAFNSVQ